MLSTRYPGRVPAFWGWKPVLRTILVGPHKGLRALGASCWFAERDLKDPGDPKGLHLGLLGFRAVMGFMVYRV